MNLAQEVNQLSREGIILIKPREGSKKFQTLDGMKTKANVTKEDGTIGEENLGVYTKERFPKSRQFFRGAPWSSTKRKFLLKDFPENSEELDKLVKACRLKYPSNHINAGKYIESCDIKDPSDAFFNHFRYRVLGQEGSAVLRKDDALEYLIAQGLMMNPKFAYVVTENNKIHSTAVKYLLVDGSRNKSSRKATRDKDIEVTSMYSNLNDKKKMAVALNLGLIKSEDTDRALVDDLLWDFAMSKDVSSNTGETKQDTFIRMCNLDIEKLNTQTIITRAKNAGYLKKTKQGWLLFGNSVGKSDLDIAEYFNNGENALTVERLVDQLGKI